MSTLRKLIIDTDPGVDDAFAISCALLSNKFDCLGITTVAGNVSIDHVTNNALRFLEFLEMTSIPVYRGAGEPMVVRLKEDAKVVHGTNGFGDYILPDLGKKEEEMHAVDFIIEMAKKYPNELEIVAIGPLTNLGMAIKKDPEAMKNVKVLWTMGGGVEFGNRTPYAEFNYWADPESVQITFDYGVHFPIYMFGLDATHKLPFTPYDISYLRFEGGAIGELLTKISYDYGKIYWSEINELAQIPHDILPVLYAIDNTTCDAIKCHVSVVTEGEEVGRTVCDVDNKLDEVKNVYVCLNPDADRLRKLFFSSFVSDKSLEDYMDRFCGR